MQATLAPAETSFAPLMQIAPRPPIVFSHGQGSWLTDDRGRRYLDFVQGWAVNCLGHSPPAVVEAVAARPPGSSTAARRSTAT